MLKYYSDYEAMILKCIDTSVNEEHLAVCDHMVGQFQQTYTDPRLEDFVDGAVLRGSVSRMLDALLEKKVAVSVYH